MYFELAFGLAGRRGGQMDQASRPEPVELRAGDHRILLAGKIDRVDRIGTGDAAGLLVVDYKTGRLPTAADVLTGHDLQLALYAQAVEAMLGEPCAGGAYHDVPNLRVQEASTSKMPRSPAAATPCCSALPRRTAGSICSPIAGTCRLGPISSRSSLSRL